MSSTPTLLRGTAPPSRSDVERQLDTMLDHRLFALRPKQAELFSLLVRGTLDGKEMAEKYVRGVLYPEFDEESSIVRGTVDLVRKSLTEYYETDGKEDLVIVALPKSKKGKRTKFAAGEAYKPSFSYNPRHEALKLFRLGSYYSRRGGPTDLPKAMVLFASALKIHPGHADSVVGIIWGFLGAAWLSTGEVKRGLIENAEFCSDAAINRFPAYWRSHFMRANVLATKGDLIEARKAYQKALLLDEKSTLASVRLTSLLRQLGDTRAQLKLSQAYLDEHLNDPEAYVVHGSLLLTMERFDDAILSSQEALNLDRNYLPAHFLMASSLLLEKRFAEADLHIERIRILADEETFAKLQALFQYMQSNLGGKS